MHVLMRSSSIYFLLLSLTLNLAISVRLSVTLCIRSGMVRGNFIHSISIKNKRTRLFIYLFIFFFFFFFFFVVVVFFCFLFFFLFCFFFFWFFFLRWGSPCGAISLFRLRHLTTGGGYLVCATPHTVLYRSI